MKIDLYPHQLKALNEIHNGCIIRGGVGSGKSITALTYFFTRVMKGSIKLNGRGDTAPFQNPNITKLLIITPAKKRENLEWEQECSRFSLGRDSSISFGNIEVIIDSWNNIGKYVEIDKAFVIFDEQRLVGSGVWVKAFYKIAARNEWIILSATPGDTWLDYIPVFVANGFYKNRTEFIRRHVVYSNYSKFPKIERYLEQGRLYKLRAKVLVEMPYARHTKRHVRTIPVEFDLELFNVVWKRRWNPWDDEPIKNISALMYYLRRVVNGDQSRIDSLQKLMGKHERLIVFYNFTYELEMMRSYLSGLDVTYSEWNGRRHQSIPDTDSWIYLVQTTAGAEAWNCTTTNAMIFYSLQYSWKNFEQCQGRIDRLDTPFEDLYYYVFRSNSFIDNAIWKKLLAKEKFQESKFAKEHGFDFAE